MAPPFALDEARLIGLFVESVLYGVYLITFVRCMSVLLRPWRGVLAALASPLVAIALLMAVTTTLNLLFLLLMVLDGFIWRRGSGLSPEQIFSDLSSWTSVGKLTTFNLQIVLGDLTIIYRCFYVYGGRWIVVLVPLVMLLAYSALALITIYMEATLHIQGTLVVAQLGPFVVSTMVLTLVQSVICTTLIAHRIWSALRKCPHCNVRRSPMSGTMRIVLESGSLYACSSAILLVSYLKKNNSIYVVSEAIVVLIGIIFNLIALQSRRNRKNGDAHHDGGACLPAALASANLDAANGARAEIPVVLDINRVSMLDAVLAKDAHELQLETSGDAPRLSMRFDPRLDVAWAGERCASGC